MNRLAAEKSPYLLQHRTNPVSWHPWGEEAFAQARREGKPIFLSIGYSTCHWCHVMAHESFADQEVADELNKNYISIKVDREERPDVDDIFMSALQTLSGGGGWPMSVWLTPDGKPFFAGTYFPKYRFLQILRRIQEIWSSDREKLREDGDRLVAALRQNQVQVEEDEESHEAEYEEFLGTYINHYQLHYDDRFGGFGGKPKFPQTMSLMVMMRQDFKSGLNQAQQMVVGTLMSMLRGGIYDQLHGGFHRYSVDERWLVPHFEKMLYDQAMISMTMLEAYQLYDEPELARGVRETLDYVLREMTHPQGGFYAAQDADSLDPEKGHNEEGHFAVFSWAELTKTLSDDELKMVQRVYGATVHGNFEGRNILHLQDEFDGKILLDPTLQSARSKLTALRASRPVPHLDDKVICAWNGFMVASFVRAGVVLEEPRYIQAGEKALSFIQAKLWKENKLSRFWRDGEARAPGAAEDYAAMIHACIEVYQATFDAKWAQWALELQKTFDQDFGDREDGGYFITDGSDANLPLRSKDQWDGVTPSSNSLAAYNLIRLYALTGDGQLVARAQRIFIAQFPKLKRSPSTLPFLALAMDFELSEPKTAVASGSGWAEEWLQAERKKFYPYILWAKPETGWPVTAGKVSSESRLFICEKGQCLKPATTADQALQQLLS